MVSDVGLFLLSPVWVPGAAVVYPFRQAVPEPEVFEVSPGQLQVSAPVGAQATPVHMAVAVGASAAAAGGAYMWGGKKGLLIYAGITYLLGGLTLAAVESI